MLFDVDVRTEGIHTVLAMAYFSSEGGIRRCIHGIGSIREDVKVLLDVRSSDNINIVLQGHVYFLVQRAEIQVLPTLVDAFLDET